jgi:hypothetical protein
MIYTDPCATALELRAAYFDLIKGSGAQRIKIEGGGGSRDVTFHPADKEALRLELRAAEEQCMALTTPNTVRRRYAIRAGQRVRNGGLF